MSLPTNCRSNVMDNIQLLHGGKNNKTKTTHSINKL